MKLKRLKHIIIGGLKFKIIWDPKSREGRFTYEPPTIYIGISDGELMSFEILIHELKEIINIEQSTRYTPIDNRSNYFFAYYHAQHTDLCARLAGLLDKFIK